MSRALLTLMVALSLALFSGAAVGQTPTCDKLTDAQEKVAMGVLRSAHPHDCCDGTILECLSKKPVCALAVRLANDVCRRAALGQSQPDIERELARRAASTMSKVVAIDVAGAAVAGDAKAPVEIVAYLCGRCPFCAKLTPELYASVTSGKLRGKAKLIVRPFPVRSHKHSTLLAKAMVAALRMEKFWPMLLQLYAKFDGFDPERLGDCAASAGLDRERFRQLLDAPEVEQILVAAKKEGVRNQVDATPTIFVNRRKYQAELSLAAIEDFVEEQLETR